MNGFLREKRVLLTSSHADVGSGGAVQMALLARGLTEAGAHVDVLLKQSDPEKKCKLELLETLPVRLDFFQPNRWYSPIQVRRLRQKLLQHQYQIVHTHKGGDLSLVLLAGLGLKLPVLVNTRGVNFPLGSNRFKYRSKRLDRVIAVSCESQRVMVRCGVPEKKIQVIYGGVDIDRFRPGLNAEKVQTDLGLPEGAPVFLVVANLVFQKGHSDYLEAAAILEQTLPGCRHVFAGSGNPTALALRAKELGLEGRVIFAGFRQDVPELFAASFASVFPGFAGEGVSGVLRESLACNVPVITTDVGGNAELIEHKKFGLVVPKRNPRALAEAMARLLQDRAYASALADQGRRFVVENHSVAARNQRIFLMYRQIALEKGYDWAD